MGCPALGIWVAFLKQPDYFQKLLLLFFRFFLGVLHQAVLAFLKKPTQIPNAGHPI
jgi:hypothetical protein